MAIATVADSSEIVFRAGDDTAFERRSFRRPLVGAFILPPYRSTAPERCCTVNVGYRRQQKHRDLPCFKTRKRPMPCHPPLIAGRAGGGNPPAEEAYTSLLPQAVMAQSQSEQPYSALR